MSTETPTAASLVAYLNDNARRIQSLDCEDLDLDCRQQQQSAGLTGWLVCRKPRNFRMVAKVVGKEEVDMGSNDQEFWYWIRRAEPPYLFHCSYADFDRGQARMPFPFQPEWIIQALGVAEYGPAENYQVVPHPTSVELVESIVSPQGQRVRKVTVFSRGQAQGTTPQVTAHLLQDAAGKEICAAYISEVQQDRTSGAVLPRRMRLVWPSEQIEMKLKLDTVKINTALKGQMFGRPNLANVPTYDLARGPDGPAGSVHRAGGIMR